MNLSWFSLHNISYNDAGYVFYESDFCFSILRNFFSLHLNISPFRSCSIPKLITFSVKHRCISICLLRFSVPIIQWILLECTFRHSCTNAKKIEMNWVYQYPSETSRLTQIMLQWICGLYESTLRAKVTLDPRIGVLNNGYKKLKDWQLIFYESENVRIYRMEWNSNINWCKLKSHIFA